MSGHKAVDALEVLAQLANEYIYPVIQQNLYDCSDSMHQCEAIEYAFEFMARFAYGRDDARFITIKGIIQRYCMDRYIDELKKVMKAEGVDKLEDLPLCGELPIYPEGM